MVEIRVYESGYRRTPESEDEIAAALATAMPLLMSEWDS